MSDEALKAKTGCTWERWVGPKLPSKEVAAEKERYWEERLGLPELLLASHRSRSKQ